MWVSKLGTIYELARLYRNASDVGFNSSFNEVSSLQCIISVISTSPTPSLITLLFLGTQQPPLSFDNMVMHQCADPAVTNWEWGKAVLAIALAQAIESKMFRSGDDPSPTVR